MASINQLFTTMISNGAEAIDGISDPKDKAMAFAALAGALAQTGLVSIEEGRPSSIPLQEDLEEMAKPKAPAPTASKKAEPKKAAAKKVEPVVEEVETPEEWTDEAIALMPEEYEALVEMLDEYEEESLNDVVSNFSEGVLSEIHDITPLNVKAFLHYVKMLLSEDEA